MYSDSLRQYFRNCLYKSPRRIVRTSFSISHSNLAFCLRKRNLLSCKAYKWAQKYSGRLLFQALKPLRMASSSSPFLSFGPSVGPSRHRSFCLYDQHPIASIQQSFCRSSVIRDRCFKPTKLGIYEQLCKSTISYDSTSTTENSASQSISNCDRPKMARTNMVSAITTHVHRLGNLGV